MCISAILYSLVACSFNFGPASVLGLLESVLGRSHTSTVWLMLLIYLVPQYAAHISDTFTYFEAHEESFIESIAVSWGAMRFLYGVNM